MTPDLLITFGLCWINAGLVLGAPMALAFLHPDWLGGYGSAERRILRLSHVAFIMLSLLCIIYGYALKTGSTAPRSAGAACGCLLAGSLLLPLVLLAGVRWRRALWSLPFPFALICAATLSAAAGRLP